MNASTAPNDSPTASSPLLIVSWPRVGPTLSSWSGSGFRLAGRLPERRTVIRKLRSFGEKPEAPPSMIPELPISELIDELESGVRPVPDGTCDLTAHVALDACAATTGAQLLTQREALLSLGISAALPPHVDAATLERVSQARELLDPDGLGAFGWLVQSVGVDAGWMLVG